MVPAPFCASALVCVLSSEIRLAGLGGGNQLGRLGAGCRFRAGSRRAGAGEEGARGTRRGPHRSHRSDTPQAMAMAQHQSTVPCAPPSSLAPSHLPRVRPLPPLQRLQRRAHACQRRSRRSLGAWRGPRAGLRSALPGSPLCASASALLPSLPCARTLLVPDDSSPPPASHGSRIGGGKNQEHLLTLRQHHGSGGLLLRLQGARERNPPRAGAVPARPRRRRAAARPGAARVRRRRRPRRSRPRPCHLAQRPCPSFHHHGRNPPAPPAPPVATSPCQPSAVIKVSKP